MFVKRITYSGHHKKDFLGKQKSIFHIIVLRCAGGGGGGGGVGLTNTQYNRK